jgi:hypothetical protein
MKWKKNCVKYRVTTSMDDYVTQSLQINVRENLRGNHEWTMHSRETGNIGYTIHRRKTNTTKTKTQKTKKMSNTEPTKNRG